MTYEAANLRFGTGLRHPCDVRNFFGMHDAREGLRTARSIAVLPLQAHLDAAMTEEEREAMKSAMKEAIKEWLDERFQEFGKWSFGAILAAALGALTYFILMTNGWHR